MSVIAEKGAASWCSVTRRFKKKWSIKINVSSYQSKCFFWGAGKAQWWPPTKVAGFSGFKNPEPTAIMWVSLLWVLVFATRVFLRFFFLHKKQTLLRSISILLVAGLLTATLLKDVILYTCTWSISLHNEVKKNFMTSLFVFVLNSKQI